MREVAAMTDEVLVQGMVIREADMIRETARNSHLFPE